MTTGGALHLLLATALAMPPASTEGSVDTSPSQSDRSQSEQSTTACAANDLLCVGRAFVASATTATSGKQRAQYLYGAHRAFLRLFDSTQDSQYLCQAQDLLRQARKIPANQLGQRLLDSERETQSRLHSSVVECSPGRSKRTRRSSAAVATTTTEPAPQSTPPADPAPVPTATATATADQAALQPPRTLPVSQPRLAAGPQVEHRAPVLSKSAARPAKPWMIGGGVALATSLVLTGLTVYYPVRAAVSRRTCVAEQCTALIDPSEDELTKFSEYEAGGRAYVRDLGLGFVLGITAAGTLATAIALLTIGARRRSNRLAAGPMLGPGAGGLQFTGRF